MCGVLDADAVMTGRLTLGYRDAVAAATSPLALAGTRVHGHEFHRTADPGRGRPGPGAPPPRGTGGDRANSVTEGFVQGQVHASYLHTHWNGVPGAADRITAAAREYRRSREAGEAGHPPA